MALGKQWSLTGRSLQGLLAFLDPDPQKAGEKYEKIREKLSRFFEWKGCIPGDEYADETFDRVARRLEEGIETTSGNPYLFFHGVALNVIRERWRKAGRDPQGLSAEMASQASDEPSAMERERRLACLEACLERLPPPSRELLTLYHLGGSGPHIGRRQDLAERLSIPAPALRLRVFRIRRQIEKCLSRCIEMSGADGH